MIGSQLASLDSSKNNLCTITKVQSDHISPAHKADAAKGMSYPRPSATAQYDWASRDTSQIDTVTRHEASMENDTTILMRRDRAISKNHVKKGFLAGRLDSWLSRTPKLDLQQCLRDRTRSPVSLSDFRTFLDKVEFGSEILDYYLAVDHLSTTVENNMRSLAVSSIIDTFIRVG